MNRTCRAALALAAAALLAWPMPAATRAQDPAAESFSTSEQEAFREIVTSALGRGHRAAKSESVADAVKEMDARAKERMDRMLRGLRDRAGDRARRDLYARFLDALTATADAGATNAGGSADAGNSASAPGLAAEYFATAPDARAELMAKLDATGALDKAAAQRWTAAAIAAAKPLLKADGESVTVGQFTMRYHIGGELKPGEPLFIYLHGGGANADMNERAWKSTFNLYKAFGFAGGVAARVPDDSSVVGWREHSAVMCIARLIDQLVATYGLDTNRVYVAGGSMGAWGISTMAPALADRVTAFCCHYGGGCEYRGFGMENTRNTPICIGIGDADTQFGRLQGSRFLRDTLTKLHEGDSGGYDLHYVEWPGIGHAPARGCEATFGQWLLARTRAAAPKTVVWQPTRPFRNRFAWLERAAPVAVQPNRAVHATIDGNTIRLRGHVQGLVLNLNDELVDLSQPVKVMAGEQVLFEGVLERRAAQILASVDAAPDPARVYCARLQLP